MTQLQANFERGQEYLADKGLNLVGVLDIPGLPNAILEPLKQTGIPLQAYSRLVVIGHAGKRLWEVLAEDGRDIPDPVDSFSIRHTTHFVENILEDEAWQLLYPSDIFFPLNELGELAGFGQPSPLFIGINPEYGLWWAYRAVFLTRLALPLTEIEEQAHPCESCLDKPCISICPADALSADAPFNIYACADYRAKDESRCGYQCLARLACPVGTSHRYSREQITYHYSQSLATIKLYKAGGL